MKNGAPTTLDDLYQLITGISDGQVRLEKRFDGLEQRFDGLDGRSDEFEKRFDRIEKRFDDQDAYLELSFTTIQQQFMEFQEKLDAIIVEIEQIKTWFDRQEKINDIEETERLAMGQKIERTIGHCRELAKEIGYDLKI